MVNAMGVINLYEQEQLLKSLSGQRPLAAVPIMGRYRLIDFVLSNMVNSGIHNVGILMPVKYRSLMDHIRSGKEWDLARKRDGLFILPPVQTEHPFSPSKGDLENLYGHIDYLKSSRQKYVVISGGNMVCNINYRDAFNFHRQQQADVTVIFKELPRQNEEELCCTCLELNEDGRIIDMAVNPVKRHSNNVSMEMYILEKNLLVDLIDSCVSRGQFSLLRDGFMKNIKQLKIYGYAHKGYLSPITSVLSYYRTNMEVLQPAVYQELFFRPGLIHTKVNDVAPTQYKDSAIVRNAMIANGCVIEGTVENSILFRGVRVKKGAVIRNSIIMQKGEVAENSVVENVICDKDVHITQGRTLRGELSYPLVIEKGTVI